MSPGQTVLSASCRRPVLPGPAPPSQCAPRPDPPWYVRVLDSTGSKNKWTSSNITHSFFASENRIKFPDMPCMKRVTETKKRRHIVQQPGTKSVRGPADKPLINRLSTARCVPPSVYRRIRLFVLPKTHPGGHSSIVWRVRGTVFSWANSPVGVLCCPSPPGPTVPPCAAPYRPARGMSGFWTRQVSRCAVRRESL